MKRQHNNGFTVVELLVVVAVAALLMALLLPALKAAKEQAQRLECATFMRQIGLGLTTYRQENNGYVYPMQLSGVHSWPVVIDEYLGGRGHEVNWNTVTQAVWACPVNTPNGYAALRETGKFSASNTGYVANRITMWDDSANQLAAQIHKMRRPAQAAYLIESLNKKAVWTTWGVPRWGYPPAEEAFLNHRGGSNLLAMDTHVEMINTTHPLYSIIQSVWWKRKQ